MLCHSKVWSRVWRHRCNVNMNPYISVCRFLAFSFFLSCLSISLLLFYLASAFICFLFHWRFRREVISPIRAVRLDLSWPSPLAISSHFCASFSHLPSSLLLLSFTFLYVTLFKATEMYERNCIYRLLFVLVTEMSHSWFFYKIHCTSLVFPLM